MAKSTTFSFDDAYSYQATVRTGDIEIIVTARGEFNAHLTLIDFKRLWMQRGDQNLPMVVRNTEIADRAAIFFLAGPDDPEIIHDGRELDAGEIVVNCMGSISHLRTRGPMGWGSLSLTPDDLAAAGKAIAGCDLHPPHDTIVIQPGSRNLARLRAIHRTAASLAQVAPQSLAHSELGRSIENDLTHATIACLSEHREVRDTFGSRCHSIVMARFAKTLEAHPRNPLYLAEICAATGVSERTLQACCREQLGMGPIKFLWLRRMHLARRELMKANREKTSVTAIAMDHGFGELGRFSVAYRSLFGESPSQTLAGEYDVEPLTLRSPFAAAFAASA